MIICASLCIIGSWLTHGLLVGVDDEGDEDDEGGDDSGISLSIISNSKTTF